MGLEAAAIAGIVSAVVGAGTAAYSITEAQGAKRDAKKERARQIEQQRLQQRIEQARIRRETRIKQARMLASQGASGADSSMIEGAIIGTETSAKSASENLQQATAANVAAISANTESTLNQLDTGIAKQVGAIASTALTTGSEFLSGLGSESIVPEVDVGQDAFKNIENQSYWNV